MEGRSHGAIDAALAMPVHELPPSTYIRARLNRLTNLVLVKIFINKSKNSINNAQSSVHSAAMTTHDGVGWVRETSYAASLLIQFLFSRLEPTSPLLCYKYSTWSINITVKNNEQEFLMLKNKSL